MASKNLSLALYSGILVYNVCCLAYSGHIGLKMRDEGALPFNLKQLAKFRLHFFTIWNYAIQICFLSLAVTDEACKLVNLSKIQKSVERVRLFLFSTLVFPCSLMVSSIFWTIWHIDRELIFPKSIDDFYPSWLNHTLHTFIIVPLVVEVLAQSKNENYRISRTSSALILGIYCLIYQSLFFSVFLRHGIWLYPVYKVLTWDQRVIFSLAQFFLGLAYQQIGISLLKSDQQQIKTKTK